MRPFIAHVRLISHLLLRRPWWILFPWVFLVTDMGSDALPLTAIALASMADWGLRASQAETLNQVVPRARPLPLAPLSNRQRAAAETLASSLLGLLALGLPIWLGAVVLQGYALASNFALQWLLGALLIPVPALLRFNNSTNTSGLDRAVTATVLVASAYTLKRLDVPPEAGFVVGAGLCAGALWLPPLPVAALRNPFATEAPVVSARVGPWQRSLRKDIVLGPARTIALAVAAVGITVAAATRFYPAETVGPASFALLPVMLVLTGTLWPDQQSTATRRRGSAVWSRLPVPMEALQHLRLWRSLVTAVSCAVLLTLTTALVPSMWAYAWAIVPYACLPVCTQALCSRFPGWAEVHVVTAMIMLSSMSMAVPLSLRHHPPGVVPSIVAVILTAVLVHVALRHHRQPRVARPQ